MDFLMVGIFVVCFASQLFLARFCEVQMNKQG